MMSPVVVVLCGVVGTLLLGWGYFARYALACPPLGVINGWDVAVLLGGVVVAPVLYLGLPRPLAVGLLGVALLSILYALAEPLLRARWTIWLAVLGVEGAALAAARTGAGPLAWAVNDAVVVLTVVGLANLWAQSGLSARALAAFSAVLAVYDQQVENKAFWGNSAACDAGHCAPNSPMR